MIEADHPERPAFEAWVSQSSDMPLEQITMGRKKGHYRDVKVEWAWEAWRARAVLPAASAGDDNAG